MSEGPVSALRGILIVLLAIMDITSCQRKPVEDQSAKVASLTAENRALRARLEQVQRQAEPARQPPAANGSRWPGRTRPQSTPTAAGGRPGDRLQGLLSGSASN